VNTTPSSQPSPTTTTNSPLRGRTLVLASSEDILDAFLFFYFRVPAALISWTMGQQAFNSCMILLLDAIELGTVTSGALKVEKAYVVFQNLQDVHNLASLAVERISWGLKKINDITQLLVEPPRPNDSRGGDAEIQGAWGEAVHGPHPMCEESVMSATGMLLLEDPGLQGFVPEAFAPIAWNLGGVEPPMPFQLKRERGQEFSQSSGLLDSIGSDEDIDEDRSVGAMQGFRRSAVIRSAPTRYATPSVDDHQPPGDTAPTLHTDIPRPTQQQHDFQTTFAEDLRRLDHSPHSRHEQPFAGTHSAWSYRPVATSTNIKQPTYAGGFPALHQAPVAQIRHNSCPAIHQSASAPSLPRPTYSSPGALNVQPSMRKRRPLPGPLGISDQASFRDFLETIPQARSPSTSSTVHPSWANKAAGRPVTLPMADPTPSCSLPFHFSQHSLVQSQEHQTAFSYPAHFAETTQMMAPGVEHMSTNDWSRWIGSSGAG
jgi:hypothetical protein